MTFALKRGNVGRGLEKLVREELGASMKLFEGASVGKTAVHKARKNIKKVRAVAKLLRRPLGRRYADENKRLRTLGHELAPVRDADAMIQTLDALRGHYSAVLTAPVVRGVAAELKKQRRESRKSLAALAQRTRRGLKRSRRTLPGRVAAAASRSAMRSGFERSYESAQDLLGTLTPESASNEFHAWRRRVKEHWYHVRLFASRHSGARARAGSLKKLETDLGDEHNLAILGAQIAANPERYGDARPTAIVIGCIEKRQSALRARALRSGRQLFAPRAKRLRAMLDSWSKA